MEIVGEFQGLEQDKAIWSYFKAHWLCLFPHLVITDSLTSIPRDSGLSEKDAEFAKPIYKFKEMLSRYGAAGILIHHLNSQQ